MTSSDKPKTPTAALHADVRRLLKKYDCPLELHQVRAQFMGAISSPIDQVNPAQEIHAIWAGQQPNFASMSAANEFMQVLVMGLWNQMSVYFSSNEPFPLTEQTPERTERALKAHAKLRYEELQSFLIGFFQGEDSLPLTPDVCDCLDVLEDLVGMFNGIAMLPKQAPASTLLEIPALIDQMAELTIIAQREINQIITISAAQRRGDEDGGDPPRLH